MLLTEIVEMLNTKENTQQHFYNLILATACADQSELLSPSMISRLVNQHKIPGALLSRYERIDDSKLAEIAAVYQEKIPMSAEQQRSNYEALCRKMRYYNTDVESIIGNPDTDFYLAYARAVRYSILHAKDISQEKQHVLELNEETIREQMLRIFQDDEINYIVIVTQVGMILTTDPEIRSAIIRYLDSGKTLEVIFNDSETRMQIGQHMVNRDAKHQTDTETICAMWKKIDEQTPRSDLFVGIITQPILHQIVKTAHMENGEEKNVSLCIRMYTYQVDDKDKNFSFCITPEDRHFETLHAEMEFLRKASFRNILIHPDTMR